MFSTFGLRACSHLRWDHTICSKQEEHGGINAFHEPMCNVILGSDQHTGHATSYDKYGTPQLSGISKCVDSVADCTEMLEVSRGRSRRHQGHPNTRRYSCQAVGIVYDILQLMTFLEWAGEWISQNDYITILGIPSLIACTVQLQLYLRYEYRSSAAERTKYCLHLSSYLILSPSPRRW